MRGKYQVIILLLVSVLFLAGGCEEEEKPLAEGSLISGTIWEKPVGLTGSNSGSSPEKGSRVEVYEGCIIVKAKNGACQVVPHGWYTNLMFKED